MAFQQFPLREFTAKDRRGAALLTVFVLLMLLAALSIAMFELSLTSTKVPQALLKVDSSDYCARMGIHYFAHQILSADLRGIGNILPRLQKEVGLKKHLEGREGWFRLDSADKELLDYRLRITGGVYLSPQVSRRGSAFIGLAYAGETDMILTVQYEVIIGPEYYPNAGIVATRTQEVEDRWELLVDVYPGRESVVLLENPDGFPSSRLGKGVEKGKLIRDMAKEATLGISKKLQAARTLSALSFPKDFPPGSTPYLGGNLPSGNYHFWGGIELGQKGDLQMGLDGGTTHLKGSLIKLDLAHLSLGLGQYMFSGDMDIKGSFVRVGDSQGGYFSRIVADKLLLDNGSLVVLGPGIYRFSSVELKNASHLFLDTTHGPVYLMVSGKGGKVILDNDSSLLIFKSKDLSGLETYAGRIDSERMGGPLGEKGQRIGQLFLDFPDGDGEIQIQNRSLLGCFATGDPLLLWGGTLETSGKNSEIKLDGKIRPSTSTPTTGVFQVWGLGMEKIDLDDSARAMGSFALLINKDDEGKITLDNSSLLLGRISLFDPERELEIKGQKGARIVIDPDSCLLTRQPHPGSSHVKFKKKIY